MTEFLSITADLIIVGAFLFTFLKEAKKINTGSDDRNVH